MGMYQAMLRGMRQRMATSTDVGFIVTYVLVCMVLPFVLLLSLITLMGIRWTTGAAI